MNKKITVSIKGVGHYLPEDIVKNIEISKDLYLSEKWVISKTGISERRKVSDNEATSDLAFKAAKNALKNAKLSSNDLDLIIVATSSPDRLFPSTSCIVQNKLKAKNASAFDISAACSGFIYGIHIGYNMLSTQYYKNIMIIGAETLSRFTNYEDKDTAFIFGDGAGSIILSNTGENKNIIDFIIGADGSGAPKLSLPANGSRIPVNKETIEQKMHYINMKGKEVFKSSIIRMSESIITILNKCDLNITNIDYFIPHQANIRIIEAIADKLSIPKEKVYINLSYLGNTGSASIPIALSECIEKNKFVSGNIILLCTFGAGYTWGSCIIKW